jgi:hypothetical protein
MQAQLRVPREPLALAPPAAPPPSSVPGAAAAERDRFDGPGLRPDRVTSESHPSHSDSLRTSPAPSARGGRTHRPAGSPERPAVTAPESPRRVNQAGAQRPTRSPARGGHHYGPPGQRSSSSPGPPGPLRAKPSRLPELRKVHPATPSQGPRESSGAIPLGPPSPNPLSRFSSSASASPCTGRVTLSSMLAGRGWVQQSLFSSISRVSSQLRSIASVGSPSYTHCIEASFSKPCHTLRIRHPFTHPRVSHWLSTGGIGPGPAQPARLIRLRPACPLQPTPAS